MRRKLHLHRRWHVWYWRRRLPARAGRSRCLDLSLGTEDRGTARRIATALDTAFEELMAQTDETTLPPGAEAAIMRAARDAILRRLAAQRAARGPDPVKRARPSAESAPLAPAIVTDLAEFLDRVGDKPPGAGGAIATVPPGLAEALLGALPARTPAPATLPSRTAAARERALRSKGIAQTLAADLAANDLSGIEPLLNTILSQLGLRPEGTARHLAAEAAMAGAIEAYRLDVDRNLGVPQPPSSAIPTVPFEAAAPSEPAGAPAQTAAPAGTPRQAASELSPDMRLSLAFARYVSTKRVGGAWNKSSERDAETALRLFVELIGDLPLRGIRRDEALRFRADLAEICSDWGQAAAYADPEPGNRNRRVDARRAVEISRQRPANIARLSSKTINKQTSHLNDFWNWAAENAGCADLPHPFRGLQKKPRGKARRSAAKEARDAFRLEEVRRIFTSDVWRSKVPFTGGAAERLRPGAKPSLYFGPLLAAYCGLRISEICQLRVGDILEFPGFWAVAVRPLAEADYAAALGGGRHRRIEEENRVKSSASDRVVPLHPALEVCGLIRYLKLRGGAPTDLLFTDVGASQGDRARGLSRFFTRLKREVGLNRPTVSFHSFRHTVRTMLDAITGDQRLVDRIIGHEDMAAAEHVRENYNKAVWLRPHFEQLKRLSYGIVEFGEDTALIDQMRRDGFLLAL